MWNKSAKVRKLERQTHMADIKKLESELWEAADELRANSKLTSQQYCMPVLGVIFLRYAQGRFKRADAQIEKERAESAEKTTCAAQASAEGAPAADACAQAPARRRLPPKSPEDYKAKVAMFIPEEAKRNKTMA